MELRCIGLLLEIVCIEFDFRLQIYLSYTLVFLFGINKFFYLCSIRLKVVYHGPVFVQKLSHVRAQTLLFSTNILMKYGQSYKVLLAATLSFTYCIKYYNKFCFLTSLTKNILFNNVIQLYIVASDTTVLTF